MPKVDEHDIGHKFPFNSNEILTNEIKEVIDMFFQAPCDDVIEPIEVEEDEKTKEDANKSDD